MATLTIRRGPHTSTAAFEPPARLSDVLGDASPAQPCGGRGLCGKCAVQLTGDVSAPNAAEQKWQVRLACQAILWGDAEVTLPQALPMAQIAAGGLSKLPLGTPMAGRFGAAIDVGTTTLALMLYDLTSGRCVASSAMANPQRAVAADVIGRIDAAAKGRGQLLQEQITAALRTMLATAAADAGIAPTAVTSLVVTGNTTMLYLLTGRDPDCLGHAPFRADCFFGTETALLGKTAYLPPCLHAFVGADTACALLSSGMLKKDETTLLCDVGTNGELALWHEGRLYIASTAAGPAFEGAGIRHGCASVKGAIDGAEVVNGKLVCHTIGGGEAVGLCGSGLLDVIACLLDMEVIDETGYMEEDAFPLRDGIVLTQGDVRAVQLAKAATCAGMLRLLDAAGVTAQEVSTVYLAGGFGSRLNMDSAVTVGLIPAELAGKVRVIGNAALDGASLLLADMDKRSVLDGLSAVTQHVRLDGDAAFAEMYVDAMLFGR